MRHSIIDDVINNVIIIIVTKANIHVGLPCASKTVYIYILANSSLPLYSRGTTYHAHVVDKLRHEEDK